METNYTLMFQSLLRTISKDATVLSMIFPAMIFLLVLLHSGAIRKMRKIRSLILLGGVLQVGLVAKMSFTLTSSIRLYFTQFANVHELMPAYIVVAGGALTPVLGGLTIWQFIYILKMTKVL